MMGQARQVAYMYKGMLSVIECITTLPSPAAALVTLNSVFVACQRAACVRHALCLPWCRRSPADEASMNTVSCVVRNEQ